jgi:predicted metal-dependent enzyme (double-stranded beta helix superfamily)
MAAEKESIMTMVTYDLARFVDDLRSITAETREPREIIDRVRPLARELALAKTWLADHHYACNEEQGFGVHLLHEEPDHTLAVFAAGWLPGRGAPPHNHGTWAVVAGVDGLEKNVFWKRLDDGSRPGHAEIQRQGEKIFGAGEVVSFLPEQIHSVVNETDRVTLSLHVYGKHVNYTERFTFDPERKVAEAFKVKEM